MVEFRGGDIFTPVLERAPGKERARGLGNLIAADPAGGRVWVDLVEVDHSVHPERVMSHIHVVDLATASATRMHRGGLTLHRGAPVANRPAIETAVIFADLLAEGHDLGVVQLGPSREAIYAWGGKITDRTGAPKGVVDPHANALHSLAFGTSEAHRAYWACDDPEMGCEDDVAFGVFVEFEGKRVRVEGLRSAEQIVWSPALGAFVAASYHGPPEAWRRACVFRITADGSSAQSLGCARDDLDNVSIAFDPAVRIALVTGAESSGEDEVNRHTWIDLTNGHVVDDLRVPRFMAPPYAPLCVWDGGLALVGAGGDTESQPAGVTLIRPGATSLVLTADVGSAACQRYPDGSIVVAAGVFTGEIGGMQRLLLDRLWPSDTPEGRG